MSDPKTTTKNGASKVEQIQARVLAPARVALRNLDNGDLAEVLLEELDRRRLDASGNQTDAPGLYAAACAAILGLLGLESGATVDRLASVGRGERGEKTDPSAVIREVAELLGSKWPAEMTPEARATMLAKTLATRFRRRNVDAKEIAAALEKTGSRQRIEWVLRAAKIETTEAGIKAALRNR
jgi:hypothetical protein